MQKQATSLRALQIENSQLRKIINSLIQAGDELSCAANNSLDLDLAVGNEDFPDVHNLSEALDQYDAYSNSTLKFLEYLNRR